ncbi:MAG: hypothetical protein LBR53_11875 [Deltaproteobacteria bacterium]|nr:hypothetical protein [Deltaproteobacteria bacterium]
MEVSKERVRRERRNRKEWFVMPMMAEPHMERPYPDSEPCWGFSVPVSPEVFRHIMSFLHKMERCGMRRGFGDEIDRRHLALIEYFLVSLNCHHNREIPPECLDVHEFFKNSTGSKLKSGDIKSFDEFMELNGESIMKTRLLRMMRKRNTGAVCLSSLGRPEKGSRLKLGSGAQGTLDYRMVINREGVPLHFASYPAGKEDVEAFMRIVFEIKRESSMKRLYVLGDAHAFPDVEPQVLKEIRARSLPLSMERMILELHRTRGYRLAFYEHQDYQFSLDKFRGREGDRLVVFNQKDLEAERRIIRAENILKLSERVGEINAAFKKKGSLRREPMIRELFNGFGRENLERLSPFVMVCFDGERGLFLAADSEALDEGSVLDRLAVVSTSTRSGYAETEEIARAFRNFFKSREAFETYYWERRALLENLGVTGRISQNTLLLFAAALRFHLLYTVF